MQIVIDIPYKDFEKLATFGQFNPLDLSLAVERGIVLPKGHGRLIDADEMIKNIKPWTGPKVSKYVRDRNLEFIHYLQNAETVLDAESEE